MRSNTMHIIKRNIGPYTSYVIDWTDNGEPICSTYDKDAETFSDDKIDGIIDRINRLEACVDYTKVKTTTC